MKTVITLIGVLASASIAFGQAGQVSFRNDQFSLVSTNSEYGGAATGLTSGPRGAYYYGLWAAPAGTIDPQQFAFTGRYATNTSPGLFDGGTVSLASFPVGSSASLQVRGWSADLGFSWPQALANLAGGSLSGPAFYGESPITLHTMGSAPSIPPRSVISGPFTLMTQVPEPGSFSLLCLGAAVCLCGRRRMAR
jgi:hypothetical protein